MKTVAEIALEKANKRKKQKEIEESNRKAEQKMLKEKEAELNKAIIDALKSMKKLPGVKVTANSININGHKFKVYTEYVSGTFRPADDCPEIPYQNYVIRWEDSRGNIYGGYSDIEYFSKRFAQDMSEYL